MREIVYVAGHAGLVGAALCRALGPDVKTFSKRELDLRDGDAVTRAFASMRPTQVYLAAARVGGILANQTSPADFIRDNLLIQTNVIHACCEYKAKLLFLGSSCIYPRKCPQPIREEYLGTGPLEPTNEAYAWAKLAGIATVKAYRRQHGLRGICVMPSNLYGPGDNFDPKTSHAVASLLRRCHESKLSRAKEFVVWGTGNARREYLHVDDLADACLFLMEKYDNAEILNVGAGEDMTIRELASAVKSVVEYDGAIRFDASKPDGTPRKLLDVSRMTALGWQAKRSFRGGLVETYKWWRST